MIRIACAATLAVACHSPPAEVGWPTEREPCADHDPLRRALFGDLHVHTGFSFDARSYDTVLTPADAYRFARGREVALPPLGPDGQGTRTVRLAQPLDFAAVTDHAEFLGEVAQCTDPSRPRYNTETCKQYRDPEVNGAVLMALKLSVPGSARFDDVCGAFDFHCTEVAKERWLAMRRAAENAYDRSEACSFTSFPAYEYTNTTSVSNLHRNVVFANNVVPELPISMFEAPTPYDLWRLLATNCRDAGTGCDVVVLPHNSNLSNGNLFDLTAELALPAAERAARAELRASMEPVVELFQHKGDSECRNGLGAEHDPLCEFEKLRPADAEVCGDSPGTGGMRLGGCVHRLDFVRNVLTEGLARAAELGTNPYRLGFIGSTDTHNGTPGHVGDYDFPGHIGVVDDTLEERLGSGNVTHDGVINNPGGLAGVWATENSREAIFEALRRRETFATSGPRIPVRFFAGDYADDVCALEPRERARAGYDGGVPMGGALPAPGASPSFIVDTHADSLPLDRVQIVKGWVGADGVQEQRVYDVAVLPRDDTLDVNQCIWVGGSVDSYQHCAVWRDPDYDPAQAAFYYARVLETPICRWSAVACSTLPAEGRPAGCTDPEIETVVQQRAWSSPIWIEPR